MQKPITAVSNRQDDEYSAASALAKEALSYIGTFRTPPTPDVYSVWYCYCEGGNPAINQQLQYAVDVAKSVSRSKLESLKTQFLVSSDIEKSCESISRELNRQLDFLQDKLTDHSQANSRHGSTLASTNSELKDASSPEEISQAVDTLIHQNQEMQCRIDEMEDSISAAKSEIGTLQEQLEETTHSSLTDPLTGVKNRRFFDQQLTEICDADRIDKGLVYLILVDIDHFKEINDSEGHLFGDLVITTVAKSLQSVIPNASISRFGGDEFGCICKSSSEDEARDLAMQAQRYLQASLADTLDLENPLTVSLGMALLRSSDNPTSWLERADRFLYGAKSQGRNQFCIEPTFSFAQRNGN